MSCPSSFSAPQAGHRMELSFSIMNLVLLQALHMAT